MSKILFLGDSIVKGTGYGGVTLAQTFAKKIGLANGYADADIINAGVGSDTSAGALARLPDLITTHAPNVVVIMIGVNDLSASITGAQSKANVIAMVNLLKAANIKPVIMSSNLLRGTIAATSGYQPYLWALDELTRSEGVEYVDLYRSVAAAYIYTVTTTWQAMYVDSIHLTVAGHQFVTDFAARPVYAGVFLPDVVVPPEEPEIPASVQTLALATADHILASLSAETLTALQTARAAFVV